MGNCDIDGITKQLGLLKLGVSIVVACCVATAGGAWRLGVLLGDLNAKNAEQDARAQQIATRLESVNTYGTEYGKQITRDRNDFERRVIEDLAAIKQQLRDRK